MSYDKLPFMQVALRKDKIYLDQYAITHKIVIITASLNQNSRSYQNLNLETIMN